MLWSPFSAKQNSRVIPAGGSDPVCHRDTNTPTSDGSSQLLRRRKTTLRSVLSNMTRADIGNLPSTAIGNTKTLGNGSLQKPHCDIENIRVDDSACVLYIGPNRVPLRIRCEFIEYIWIGFRASCLPNCYWHIIMYKINI